MNDEFVLSPALFAALLTAAGAPIASTIIWAVLDLLKQLEPVRLLLSGREKTAAFLGAILVVVVCVGVGLLEEPPRYAHGTALQWVMLIGGALLAIYNIGRLAMAVHDDVNRYPGSLTEPSPQELAARAAREDPQLPGPGGSPTA